MSTHSSASSTTSSSQRQRQQQQQQQQQKQKQQPNIFQKFSQNIEMAKKGYEQLVHAIIRPPRSSYKVNQLGPTNFIFCGQEFQRNDVELITPFTKTETVNNDFKNSSSNSSNSSSSNDSDDDSSGGGGGGKEDNLPSKVTTTKQLRMQVSIWTRCNTTNSNDNNNDDGVTTKETKEADNNIETSKKHTTFIVFMHGNASAKTEVIPQLGFLLAQGLDGICSFDFTGSGLSEGEYVSLGYYERFDLECVLQYLQNLYSNEDLEIILWGRSMGASTALMYASEITTDEYQKKTSSLSIKTTNSDEEEEDEEEEFDDPDYPKRNNMNRETSTTAKILVKGLICDSPFASLPILCEELVEKARSQGIVVPGVIVSVALAMIGRSVKHYANFDIRDINPLEHTPTIDIPTLFIVGSEDDFIPPHHSEELIASFQSGVRTNLFMVPGGHNDARPPVVYEAVSQFIQNRFTNSHTTISKQKLDVPTNIQSILHSNPPWAYSRYPTIFTALKQRTARMSTAMSAVATAAGTTTTTMSDEQEELGMTQERVDDIQNKLHHMLGQGSSDIN